MKHDYSSAAFSNTIFELAKQGLSNREIANALSISGETFRRYAKLNPDISHALAWGRFRCGEPLRDTDIPDEELFSWMIDLCVRKPQYAETFGLTKRRVGLWAQKSRDIKRIIKTSKSWAMLQKRDNDGKWI